MAVLFFLMEIYGVSFFTESVYVNVLNRINRQKTPIYNLARTRCKIVYITRTV